MSCEPTLATALQQARRRAVAIRLAMGLPWLVLVRVLAWRSGHLLADVIATVLVFGLLVACWRAWRALDNHWLAQQLDALRPDFEDSSALLLNDTGTVTGLARLQQQRLRERLNAMPLPCVRSAWPWAGVLTQAGVAAAVGLLLWAWPTPQTHSPATAHSEPVPASGVMQSRLTRQRLHSTPPAYTGLAEVEQDGLSMRVPQGALLRWELGFAPQPEQARLVFHDGRELALQREGEYWRASARVDQALLYRVQIPGAPPLPDAGLQRIEVTTDAPPELNVQAPDSTLSLVEPGQRQWRLLFEASDDYGLGPAQLQLTHTQGNGEVVTVKTRRRPINGAGDSRQRRYAVRLDLAREGLAVGDDLIVRLQVTDNRTPGPQLTRSASYILRWPPDSGAESSGLEGMVKRTLPAYFRSQRQIIIDSEALLSERQAISAARFLARADAIGVDQRILRLRYGEFLGEETGGEPERPQVEGESEPAGSDADGHRTAQDVAAQATGDAAAIVEAFGHSHDHAEATTLLDPETRAHLKKALDNMWQAELHLRQGHPDAALPFEYRALGFIKQVQQASRIYLARVGLELPPIDDRRRLSGDRAGLRSRPDHLPVAQREATPADLLWARLGSAQPQRAELQALASWLSAHASEAADGLPLYEAIDALNNDPSCQACAQTLRSWLWPLLSLPATEVPVRVRADHVGRAYLNGLPAEGGP